MTDATQPNTSYKPLGTLILGYLMILIGIAYSMLLIGTTFHGGPNPTEVGVLLFFNFFGFVLIIYGHVVHLVGERQLSRMDKQIYGVPARYIITSVVAAIPIVCTIETTDSWKRTINHSTATGVIDFLCEMIVAGITFFNGFFVLIGPFYILGFYLIAVRESSEG